LLTSSKHSLARGANRSIKQPPRRENIAGGGLPCRVRKGERGTRHECMWSGEISGAPEFGILLAVDQDRFEVREIDACRDLINLLTRIARQRRNQH